MAKTSFEKRIDKILASLDAGGGKSGYEKTKARLRQVCERIEAALSKGAENAVVVSLQPGFRANMGQQLNVVVEILERRYQDTFFRVYVPSAGQPIHLDFYGEQPVEADTLKDMEGEIAAFLSQEDTQTRLSDYRDLAMK